MTFLSIRPIRQALGWRWYLITTTFALTLALAACGGRLSLPGAMPTAQPVAAAVEQPRQFNPSLALSPSSGHAGIYVQVAGSGWPPHMMVVVVLSDPGGISTTVASSDTDASGNLSTGFLYPIEARWLLSEPYTVVAESADGQLQASAEFRVVDPGTELTPTALATAPPTSIPTMTQTATPIATTAPTTAPTPVVTATPTLAPTPSPQPAAEVAAEAATANQPPGVEAALIPAKWHGAYQQFHIKVAAADPDANLSDVVAILQIPFVNETEEVKLRDKDKIAIKVGWKRIEIDAPDPQLLLDQIRRDGGIRVQNDQLIEFRAKAVRSYTAEIKDDVWRIRTPTLVLQVTAVDAEGRSHQVTVSHPVVLDEDDDDNDDGDEDRDDNGKNKGKGKDKNKDRGNDNDDDDDD